MIEQTTEAEPGKRVTGAEAATDSESSRADQGGVPAEPATVDVAPPSVPDPDKLQIITFDDLKIEMPADAVYAPSMLTDRVRQLDGARVRIRGFLFPGTFVPTGITQFPLIMNLECKFGPGGQAHHIILVELVPGVTTDYTTRPIAVTGRLTVKPWEGPDGNTWALYHLAGEKVQ
jgi:hypothetical protein